MSANIKNSWFQSWHDDWSITNGFPLAAKGLFREMERWAVIGKPYGHVTWPNGEVMTVAQMATATGESLDHVGEYILLMERVGAIGLAKSGAYIMNHLVRREETRKKRAKAGKNGGEVTLGKEREKRHLLKQIAEQVPKPINEKLETRKEEKIKQPKPDDPDNPYWFDSGPIRIRKRDYLEMLEAYGGTDGQFMDWLTGRAKWYETLAPPHARKNWFIATWTAIRQIHSVAAE